MCRCFTSDCPGVRIPGHPLIWCRDQVYVFIVESCENEASGDCLPTWRPDPRGNHDQCSNCIGIQRYIYPEGVRTSTSKRKVHTPSHPAPNYAPPPYVRPPGYEDSELRVAQNSTASAGPEQPLTHTRSNLTVLPSTPTRRLPCSGILVQPVRTSTVDATTRLAEPLAAANFPTPAPDTNSRLTGLRPPIMNTATRSAEARLLRAVYPIHDPETNSRRTGLRPPMMNTATLLAETRLNTAFYPTQAAETNLRPTGLRRPMASTATQVAELGPSQGTDIGRTGRRAPTASDTVNSTTTGTFRGMSSRPPTRRSDTVNSTTTGAFRGLSFRPPTRRLFAWPGSTDRLVPTAATPTALTAQQSRSASPPLARALPVVYTGHIHPNPSNVYTGNTYPTAAEVYTGHPQTNAAEVYTGHTHPTAAEVYTGHTHTTTANSQLGPGNSPSTAPRPYDPRTAGMFLAPPPRHETRSPPIGFNLSEWDFEEPTPQVNSNSDNGGLYESNRVALFNRGNYAIDARGGLGNHPFAHQSNIAQANQGSANDTGPPMENQRSSRWRSVREWARRTGESTGRREREQTRWQQRYFAFPEDGSSRSGRHANQQDCTQWRQILAEPLRALRRGPFTWRRLISQPETASHQAQARFGSLLDPTRTSVAPDDQPTAVVAGDQSTNHEPAAAASVVRLTTPLSDRTVSEFLRRTRDQVPDSSEQRSYTSSDSGSITTPSDLATGDGSSRAHEYGSRNQLPQNGGSTRSSSSGNTSDYGQDGEDELVEIGDAIVRFDAGSQATDWNWNF